MKKRNPENELLFLVLLGLPILGLVAYFDTKLLTPVALSISCMILVIYKSDKHALKKPQLDVSPVSETTPTEEPPHSYGAAIWHEENKTIDILRTAYKEKCNIVLRNCTVGKMEIQCTTFENLVIENCTIGEFNGDFIFIEGGCTIINSTFKEIFTMSCGGHNKEEAKIEGNEFFCFADFSDEVFEANFIFKNNTLHHGSNLLDYSPTALTPDLGVDPLIEGNTGNLYDEE